MNCVRCLTKPMIYDIKSELYVCLKCGNKADRYGKGNIIDVEFEEIEELKLEDKKDA